MLLIMCTLVLLRLGLFDLSKRLNRFMWLGGLTSLACWVCPATAEEAALGRADFVKSGEVVFEHLHDTSGVACNRLLRLEGLKREGDPPVQAVRSYKVTYTGQFVMLGLGKQRLSGLWVEPLPDPLLDSELGSKAGDLGESPRLVSRSAVLYTHGTVTARWNVPSRGDDTLACLFAGHGYPLMAPDYLGLGDSLVHHPYLQTVPTVEAARALVDAVQARWRTLLPGSGASGGDPRLFITGYSQGGHAALAVHRSLELQPLDSVTVLGSHPASGPYFLYPVTLLDALERPDPFASSLYFAYILASYSRFVPEVVIRPQWVFKNPYSAIIDAFDGTKTANEIIQLLPRSPFQLLRGEFIEDTVYGVESPLMRALLNNSVRPWAAQKPILLSFQGSDLSVSPRNGSLMSVLLKESGAKSVQAQNLGEDLDHATGVPFAWRLSLDFLRSLDNPTVEKLSMSR